MGEETTSFTQRLRDARRQTTTFPRSAIVFFDEAADEIERLNQIIQSAVGRLQSAMQEDDWLEVDQICEEMERGANSAPK